MFGILQWQMCECNFVSLPHYNAAITDAATKAENCNGCYMLHDIHIISTILYSKVQLIGKSFNLTSGQTQNILSQQKEKNK